MESIEKNLDKEKESKFNITLKNNSGSEQTTKEVLVRVLEKYSIEKWLKTRNIIVQDNVRPHSHPEITLNTRTQTEEQLLAVFLHEQMHWIEGNEDGAIEELKTIFPNGPVGKPEGGDNEKSTYRHLFICRLERLALIELIGEEATNVVIQNQIGYKWMRSMAKERGPEIDAVIQKYFPGAL